MKIRPQHIQRLHWRRQRPRRTHREGERAGSADAFRDRADAALFTVEREIGGTEVEVEGLQGSEAVVDYGERVVVGEGLGCEG